MWQFEREMDVVCINDGGWQHAITNEEIDFGPRKHDILKIKDFEIIFGQLFLMFYEKYGRWHAADFRPVKKMDISIFTQMLTPTSTKEIECV